MYSHDVFKDRIPQPDCTNIKYIYNNSSEQKADRADMILISHENESHLYALITCSYEIWGVDVFYESGHT